MVDSIIWIDVIEVFIWKIVQTALRLSTCQKLLKPLCFWRRAIPLRQLLLLEKLQPYLTSRRSSICTPKLCLQVHFEEMDAAFPQITNGVLLSWNQTWILKSIINSKLKVSRKGVAVRNGSRYRVEIYYTKIPEYAQLYANS
jgi:hypothetical protein